MRGDTSSRRFLPVCETVGAEGKKGVMPLPTGLVPGLRTRAHKIPRVCFFYLLGLLVVNFDTGANSVFDPQRRLFFIARRL